ncbi:hypothetical protein K438DRAFT_2135975 [Mycena galopus ATCC 62051]|nr:hypothetical protein K438DRAFT_1792593 [Mycena galopus ATCC 62051]KAF8129721.1 hypothetical protein K438DRAFT_2135975 [Mycena galopus ATCC 62051]
MSSRADDRDMIISHRVKDIFTLHLFVKKFSGTGWDDEEKHAINTPKYIEAILATHGKTYASCFKKRCLFYMQLDELYDGLKNRATGEHVIHFSQKTKRKSRRTSDKKNPTVSASASTSSNSTTITTTTPATDGIPPGPLAPMNTVINIPDEGETGGGRVNVNFADELTLSPPPRPSRKRTRSDSDDDEAADAPDATDTKGKRKRNKLDSSTSSARRNAEAGSQLARSVDNLSVAMLKPIVTTEDISFVNDVMRIPEDPTLLPHDPRGKLFNIISKALTSSPTQACIFILATNDSRRKGIISSILEEAGVKVPDDY